MAEKHNSGVSHEQGRVCWGDLMCPAPPPTCTQVHLSGAAWRHLLTKHVLNDREPWCDVLSAETRDVLAADPDRSFRNAAVAAAVGALEHQVRESLARPLALLFEVRRLGGAGGAPGRRWCLVLPAGAIAFVAARGGANNFLVTCYFPKASAVERDRQRRWRRVVRRLVLRYAVWDAQLGAIRLPNDVAILLHPAKGPTEELHSAIRFATPSTWGFCPELDGIPWRGRLASWPAAELSEVPSRPTPQRRHRIKPRRRT